jgi:YidC/Oxa1 family membrane protein insertase
MDALFEGLASVLAGLYAFTHSYGLSIILLTLGVRILVTPLTIKGTRSMMSMQRFQPEIKRLQQEHKGDRQKLNEEMMKFYKENNINPMGSCLPLLIQIPVFIVLYRVVRGITRFGSDGTFNPQYLDHNTALYKSLDGANRMMFLGLDLAKSAAGTLREDSFLRALPYLAIIAIVTGTSYIQQKQVAGRNPGIDVNPMQKNLMRIMPLSFAVFAFSFPAALGLYFMTSNTYQVAQQWYISRALYGVGKKGKGGSADGTDVGETAAPGSAGAGGNGGKSTSPARGGQGQGKAVPAKGSGKAGASGASGTRPAKAKTATAKPRPTSGRVTEPKRASNGKAGPSKGTGSSSNGRSTARPPTGGQSGGGGSSGSQSRGRRRTPFNERSSAEGTADDPQKKRRT